MRSLSVHLHPEREALLARLIGCINEISSEFSGSVYRFVRPQYSSVGDQFAGKGTLYAHSRWLLKGCGLATYTSTLPETALAEALAATRYYGFPDHKAAPLVFVTASTKLARVIDWGNGRTRQRLRLSLDTILETDWRFENSGLGGVPKEAITQAWGWAMHQSKVSGFVCPSAARAGGANLIVFPEHLKTNEHLEVLNEVEWPR